MCRPEGCEEKERIVGKANRSACWLPLVMLLGLEISAVSTVGLKCGGGLGGGSAAAVRGDRI